jgi:trimethylamine--corrinoid protein Co-methyltransferase
VRGIEVNEETLSYDVIESVVRGEGHFLREEQTLALMRTEYEYPELADRLSPNQWQETGSPDIRTQAGERVKQILSSHYPSYIAPEVDAKIRERFKIELPLSVMTPGDDRW